MFLHFEDWSAPGFLTQLEDKGLPHAGKIIKVLATQDDPRELFGKPDITVIEEDDQEFREDEVFGYEGRRFYAGRQLKEELSAMVLSDSDRREIRALFRFAYREGFSQAAMALKAQGISGRLGRPRIDHPFEDIDGIKQALLHSDSRSPMHLDIFLPDSIARIQTINGDSQLIGMMEGTRARRSTFQSNEQIGMRSVRERK
jgi:hypothetical protein